MKLYVYVAGPMRLSPYEGLASATRAAEELLPHQVYCFLPQLAHLWAFAAARDPKRTVVGGDYATFRDYDHAWVDRCHALLRLPGESHGADDEVIYARLRGIPVFFSVQEVLQWAERVRRQATDSSPSMDGAFAAVPVTAPQTP